MFVCPTYRQTLGDVIAGFEAAWAFFGAFAVVIPDRLKYAGWIPQDDVSDVNVTAVYRRASLSTSVESRCGS